MLTNVAVVRDPELWPGILCIQFIKMALVSESHTPSVISNMYQYILYSIMGANSKHIDDEYGIGDRNLYRTHPESGCAYKKITR